jgi:TetR/AcrR family transcriptional repressor of nem operon
MVHYWHLWTIRSSITVGFMGRPRAFDKDEVLLQLRDEFWAKGYAATSLDDLMEATGLGKGSLYAAFGDKQHLFHAVLAAYSAWRLAAVRDALNSGKVSALMRLRAFFSGESSSKAAGPEGARGCLLVNSVTELCSRDAEVQKLARDTFSVLEDDIVALVEEAIGDGDLPKTTHARQLGRLLHALSHGMEFLGKTGMRHTEVAAIGRSAALALLGGGSTSKTSRAKRTAAVAASKQKRAKRT